MNPPEGVQVGGSRQENRHEQEQLLPSKELRFIFHPLGPLMWNDDMDLTAQFSSL